MLYGFIDPVIRARLEDEREDEPERTLAAIRELVGSLRSVEVVELEILEAQKVCRRHGERPAALVRVVLRYDDGPTAHERRTVWVRDRGVWYSTAPEYTGQRVD
jgi:hypothetical protein